MAEIKYGLSAEGFKRKRLPEIKAAIEKRLSDKLGVPIQTRSDSVFGQLIGVFSYEIADLWEQAEGVYNAMYPHTATGVSLSNAAALAGIRPLAAERTILIVTCYGQDNTFLPFGSQVRSNVDHTCVFSTSEENYISSSMASYAKVVMPDTILEGTEYTLTVAGHSANHTARAGETATQILVALADGFYDIKDKSFAVTNGVLIIKMLDQQNVFGITVNGLILQQVGTPVRFLCDTAGAVSPNQGEVNQIVTQVAGWSSAENNVAAIVGRDAEVDIDLRSRWSRSVYSRASVMVEAIQTNIYQNVPGVSAALVYENTGDTTDEAGRPPHSVEAVVMGGEDTEIAEEIWRQKAAGIDTYGTVSKTIADTQGAWHTVCFNRPETIKVWLKISIGKNTDEDFSGNIYNEIVDAVLKRGQEYRIGQDVILQRFICAIFSSVQGVGYIDITATVGDIPGTYTTRNVVISPRQVAVFDTTRIEVTGNVATGT